MVLVSREMAAPLQDAAIVHPRLKVGDRVLSRPQGRWCPEKQGATAYNDEWLSYKPLALGATRKMRKVFEHEMDQARREDVPHRRRPKEGTTPEWLRTGIVRHVRGDPARDRWFSGSLGRSPQSSRIRWPASSSCWGSAPVLRFTSRRWAGPFAPGSGFVTGTTARKRAATTPSTPPGRGSRRRPALRQGP
jgi:hypothetical protein